MVDSTYKISSTCDDLILVLHLIFSTRRTTPTSLHEVSTSTMAKTKKTMRITTRTPSSKSATSAGFTTPKKHSFKTMRSSTPSSTSPTTASTPSSTSTASTKRSSPSKSPPTSTIKRLKKVSLFEKSALHNDDESTNKTSSEKKKKNKKKTTNKVKKETKGKKEKETEKKRETKKSAKSPTSTGTKHNKEEAKIKKENAAEELPLLPMINWPLITNKEVISMLIAQGFSKETLAQLTTRYELIHEFLALYDLAEIRQFITSLHSHHLETSNSEIRRVMLTVNKWQKARCLQEAITVLEKVEEENPVAPG